MTTKGKNSKDGATSLNKKDIEKKKMMDDFELAVAKSMTQTKLDPLGSAAINSLLYKPKKDEPSTNTPYPHTIHAGILITILTKLINLSQEPLAPTTKKEE